MIYCDTSLLISALTPEADSATAQHWLAARISHGLAISPWVDTEFAAAIAMKGRIGDLNIDERFEVLAQWRSLRSSLHEEAVTFEHFRLAAELVARPGVSLRSGDALHLAIALDRGFDLATLDKGLQVAATAISIIALDPLAT